MTRALALRQSEHLKSLPLKIFTVANLHYRAMMTLGRVKVTVLFSLPI